MKTTKTITKTIVEEVTEYTCDLCNDTLKQFLSLGEKKDSAILPCEICGKDICILHQVRFLADPKDLSSYQYLVVCIDCFPKGEEIYKAALEKGKTSTDVRNTINSLVRVLSNAN